MGAHLLTPSQHAQTSSDDTPRRSAACVAAGFLSRAGGECIPRDHSRLRLGGAPTPSSAEIAVQPRCGCLVFLDEPSKARPEHGILPDHRLVGRRQYSGLQHLLDQSVFRIGPSALHRSAPSVVSQP